MDEVLKQKILAFFESKRGKKNRLTAKDVTKEIATEDKRALKMCMGEMATEGSLKYWSSGSTTYLMLPDLYELLIKAGGEGARDEEE
jgi:hypothetical protein